MQIIGKTVFLLLLISKFAFSDIKKNEKNEIITTEDSNIDLGYAYQFPEIEDIAESIIPSVVSIISTSINQNYNDDYFIYNGEIDNISYGSGFIISEDGYIITNNHVIENSKNIKVKVENEEFEADLIGQDLILDIAIIKINSDKKFKFLELNPDIGKPKIGEKVILVGNPYNLGLSVSAGIISAIDRNQKDSQYKDSIQTDAPMNHGNSGGPMVNRYGNVIGINTFISSKTGENVGVGFAIPVDSKLLVVIEKLIKFGYNQNGYLGVSGITIDDFNNNFFKILNLKKKSGVLVTNITNNSPAEKGGILISDIIISYDGNRIYDLNTLINLVTNTTIGSNVEIIVLRNEKYIKLRIKIEENPYYTKYNVIDEKIRLNSLEINDMFVTQIDENLFERYKLYSNQYGMYVLDVKKGGWAEINGIEKGDIILTANQTQIKKKNDLINFLEDMKLNNKNEFIMIIKKNKTKKNILLKSNLNFINNY